MSWITAADNSWLDLLATVAAGTVADNGAGRFFSLEAIAFAFWGQMLQRVVAPVLLVLSMALLNKKGDFGETIGSCGTIKLKAVYN